MRSAPPGAERLSAAGLELEVVRAGAGRPLLLLHGFETVPADAPFQVGDMLSFGVSHPCTTFDRWQLLYEVDGGYDVIGAVRTFF